MNKFNVIVLSVVGIVLAILFSSAMPFLMGLLLGIALTALILGLNAGRYSSFATWPLLMTQGFGILPLPTIYIAFFVLYITQSFFKTIRSREDNVIDGYMDTKESVLVTLAIIKAEWQHKTYIYCVGLLLLTILVLVGAPGSLVRYATLYTPLLLGLSLPISLLVWGVYCFYCVDKEDRIGWLIVSFGTALVLYLVASSLGDTALAPLVVLGPLVLLSKSKLDKNQLKQFLNIKEEEVLESHYECSLSGRATLIVVLSNLFAFTSQSAVLAIGHKDKKESPIQARINNGFIGAISDMICLFILILLGLVRGDMDMMGRLAFLPTLQEWMVILVISLGVVLIIGTSFSFCFEVYKSLHSAEGVSVMLLENCYKYVLLFISILVLVTMINSWIVIFAIILNFLIINLIVNYKGVLGSGCTAGIPAFVLMSNLM